MSIFDKLFRRTQPLPQITEVKDASSLDTAAKFMAGAPSATGKSVTDSSAMSIAAAWSCMRVLSETIGAIPWALYLRQPNGNALKVDDHPLARILNQPNADMTATEYREAKVLNLCQRGNTYSFIERGVNGELSSLYPIPSSLVSPMRKKGTNTRLNIAENEPFYRVKQDGKEEDYPRSQIWHVKGFGGNGLVGLSPLGAAREAMGVALATEEFGAKFFVNGGLPSGTVTVPGWLTQEQREAARTMLNQMLGGLGNAHRFALFEGGLKPEPWGGINLEDMQFLTLRQFSVAEICRFYRVPPHMVADLSRATFSNIEQQSQDFVQYSLLPYFVRFEAAAAKWLLTPDERNRYFIRFNFEGLLRADSASRASFYNSALQNGWMNRNEVRAKENLDTVEGLDNFTVQSNMALVDSIAALTSGQQQNTIKAIQQLAENLSKNLAQIGAAQASRPIEITFTPDIRLPEIKMPPVTVYPPNTMVDNHVHITKAGTIRQTIEARDENGDAKTIITEALPEKLQ